MIKPVYLTDQSQNSCCLGISRGSDRKPLFFQKFTAVFQRIAIWGKPFLFFLIFFISLTPVRISAQTQLEEAAVPENLIPEQPVVTKSVALMTFLGDDLGIGAQFQDGVDREVLALGGYTTHRISAEEFPQSLSLSPDYPPDRIYLGDLQYSLTGEYYVDMDDLQHFQLWLWNSRNGSLVYTDEMVFEDMEEANSYLPPMVSWIFSHIPVESYINVTTVTNENTNSIEEPVVSTVEESSAPKHIFRGKLNLGIRGGGVYTTYGANISVGGYGSGQSQGFSGEGALMLEFRIFKLFGIQVEGVFTHDTFKVVKVITQPTQEVRATDHYMGMSLMFPLLLKMPIETGVFTISPFAGAYYVMPIGELTQIANESGQENVSYTYVVDPPLGLILGLEGGLRLGPGELFADLRFSRDIGTTMIRQGIQYSRSRLTLSLGYKFRLWERR
ncbi:hypothetical protein LQZ21_11130 [Treponema sp. TIM-1]|uniref:hypothetical protein n=1 Tax=Treponema sp. TIM-1 TaxID=2898417 RepID=UPI003980FB2D